MGFAGETFSIDMTKHGKYRTGGISGISGISAAEMIRPCRFLAINYPIRGGLFEIINDSRGSSRGPVLALLALFWPFFGLSALLTLFTLSRFSSRRSK